MAVNFNLLAREGPTNLYEGFVQGQQAAAQNTLAQQKMAQERELGALRRAELVGNIRAQEEKRTQDARVLRANQFKDQLLRAPTAEAMREIIRQQHADPILGPTRKQFGSLEQDLAEVPDDPAGLEEYRRREAMGISEWIKSTYKTQQDRAAMGLPPLPTFGVRGAAAPAAAPEPVGELVAEPIAAPTGTMREIAPGGTVGAEAPLTRGVQANVLAPTPPAPPPAANVLTMSPEEQRARAMLLSDTPGIREAGKIELARLTAPQVVAQGSTLTIGGKPVFTAPERQDTDLIREYNVAKREGFQGSLFDYKRQIALAGRPVTPPPPSAPVAVVDPATGNTIYVSREEALRGRMTPAGQGTNLTPKQIQTFEAKYPQATAAVKTFESKADRLAADLETLANHPGLSGISGLIYGITPAITAEARQAQALYDSIIARGGFQELQDMRSASPTGGALGPVSNTENQYLRDAFAPIKRTQDTPDLKQALLSAAQATKDSKQRVREAYDLTYEYRARRGGAGSANVDQERANARAAIAAGAPEAAVRKRFKEKTGQEL